MKDGAPAGTTHSVDNVVATTATLAEAHADLEPEDVIGAEMRRYIQEFEVETARLEAEGRLAAAKASAAKRWEALAIRAQRGQGEDKDSKPQPAEKLPEVRESTGTEESVEPTTRPRTPPHIRILNKHKEENSVGGAARPSVPSHVRRLEE